MVRFFTWHDVEIFLEERRSFWPGAWNDVKVYSDSVLIYLKPVQKVTEESKNYLKEILTKNYNISDNKILVDFTGEYLEVLFEEDEDGDKKKRQYTPLFKNISFHSSREDIALKPLPGARILAFHSYKGGVGRTLSLISLLRECTTQYPDKKILFMDADLEAPGLTWMLEERGYPPVSYLDILSVMNFNENSESAVKGLAELIKTSTVTVTTDKVEREQFFVPVYRERMQVMSIFSSPERILITKENKFYITEMLSRLGARLGAELILIDLRAGITEYSAPFLLDPRVEKYYVTSTSLQSVRGLNQILQEIYKKTNSDFLNSRILMTMIPETMGEEKVLEIQDQILNNIEEPFDKEASTFLRNDYIIPVGFDDGLIHTGDFSSVCKMLQNKKITEVMKGLTAELFPRQDEDTERLEEEEARSILRKLNEIAKTEITAEGNASANMLATSSIRELARNFRNILPRIVVAGAKGSGKTYIYKQLLAAKTWKRFEELVDPNADRASADAWIVPLTASLNLKEIKELIWGCVEHRNSESKDITVRSSYVSENFKILRDFMEQEEATTRRPWVEMWIQAILRSAGGGFQGLPELDEFLERRGKKMVCILDGLEDLCMDAQLARTDTWKYAVRAICQDVINELDNLDYGNIGILVFARRDMLSEAIDTNYEQFRNIYLKYELNWSQTEALRLVLWLAAKAYPMLSEGIDITNATKEVLAEKLTRLWGLKLGRENSKEAFSDRWIMAALSDFSGQLQARDIVRFLKYATNDYAGMNMVYPDRLIMPLEIRNAILPCSEDKLEEIKSEMKNIYEILQKFMDMDSEKKTLPMTLDKIELTGEQISRLEGQGFLKISDKKYYLPEIIRLALGFRYEKGARPKVLSLLVK